jgi:ABC transport system ATP-binding/permease protein
MTTVVSLNDISKSYGDDSLFEQLSIDFKKHEHLGLIGNNGSGKSTLLKIIAKEVDPDFGELFIKPIEKLVYLPQEDDLDPGKSIEETLYHCLKNDTIDDRERHMIVQKSMGKSEFKDGSVKVGTLSGGWKKRLAITKALCVNPNILLLDEPTNHLDISGIFWLETILKASKFPFILVSHDREFLEKVCSNILEIGKCYPEGYFKVRGPYRKFEKERKKFLIDQLKKQSSLASKMRREEEWLKKGPKARTSKAKYRIEQAERTRLELYAIKDRNRRTAAVEIDFHSTGRKTKQLLKAHNIKKTVQTKTLFSDISFEMGPKFCMGVVGENGSGKSTFLSILEKKTVPDEGKIIWAENLKIAVFDQNRNQLDPEITLKKALNPAGGDSVNYNGKTVHVVTWAKRFLFIPDQLDMPVKKLSGGEKARIILANLMLQPSDVLLLDEPTNDLDILSLEVLEESLMEFPGAVVIVSHDRYLMKRVCHNLLYLDPDGKAKFFKDFNQILKYRKEKGQPKKKPKHSATIKKKSASKKMFSYKDQYALEHIEKNILSAEDQVEKLTQAIQEPDVIKDTKKMAHYCSDLKTAEELVRKLYDQWEELEEKKALSES